jgi:hypothetical protein
MEISCGPPTRTTERHPQTQPPRKRSHPANSATPQTQPPRKLSHPANAATPQTQPPRKRSYLANSHLPERSLLANAASSRAGQARRHATQRERKHSHVANAASTPPRSATTTPPREHSPKERRLSRAGRCRICDILSSIISRVALSDPTVWHLPMTGAGISDAGACDTASALRNPAAKPLKKGCRNRDTICGEQTRSPQVTAAWAIVGGASC